MAMFAKTDPKKGTNGKEKTGAGVRFASGESAISIIGPGMRVEGDIVTEGIIRIEGAVHGTIQAGKAVVLGKDGEIVGNILTQDAVIGGRVTGTLVAESRLELQNTCVVEGDIRARAEHIQLDEGARFNGQIQMIEPQGPASAPPQAKPAEATPAPAR